MSVHKASVHGRPTTLGDKVIGLVILGLIIWALSGCTIAPRPVAASVVSFSGNTQDAGVTGPAAGGGYALTAAAVARYDDLIAKGYGKGFTPPLRPHDGILLSNGTWTIDKEHLVDFAIMQGAKRSGILP